MNVRRCVALMWFAAMPMAWPGTAGSGTAEELGERWGTEERERAYYKVVRLPIPDGLVVEAGAFAVLPDGRVAIGTRHGDVFLVDQVDAAKPEPSYHRFASGLDEIFGLAVKDGAIYVTQSCEVTRLTDRNGDGQADRFETISDDWGYANYHEYAFGSQFDDAGNLYVALGLSKSYHSWALYRGWALKITPDGTTVPIASGMRSPAGIGPNEHGALFYTESQGPWNCACSLKFVEEGGFMGHPRSFNWYPYAPHMGPTPEAPVSGSRLHIEQERVRGLRPYAVVFPYIRMGRSISGFTVDRTGGQFGPFQDQIFVGDFSLSVVLRATTEQVEGVWQGACYPFREGLSTGILDVEFTPGGRLLTGGTNRGWPVRGTRPFALERLEWTGVTPFEIECVSITPTGFDVRFTKPAEAQSAGSPDCYRLGTFTHPYHGAYGGPEIERTTPKVTAITLSDDRRTASLTLDTLRVGHVHEFDLEGVQSQDDEPLLHNHAFYTVNAVPKQ